MELNVILSSLIVAFLFLFPLAVKWQIKMRYALVGALLFGTVTGVTLSWGWLRGGMGWLALLFVELVFIVVLTVLVVAFFFYRDPERVPPKQNGIIVSPADGKVLYVKKINNGEVPLAEKGNRKFRVQELTKTSLSQNGGYLVGIGMNLLNVHVNRAPIDGKVVHLKHIKGSFSSLRNFEALLHNERLTTVIDNGRLKVGVIQIASRLVRRIVTFLEEGDSVEIGQRIGMIKFGSQVDLAIPYLPHLKLRVKPSDEVIAGESVIADCGEEFDTEIR